MRDGGRNGSLTAVTYLAGEEQAHGSLDLATGEGGLLVVPSQADGLRAQPVKGVVHEAEVGRAALVRKRVS